MYMEITSPLYLLLIPAVILYLIVTARLMVKKGRKRIRTTLAVHGLVAVLLILALCQVKVRQASHEVNTVFVADVSDSMRDYKSQAARFVMDALATMPEDNYAGIVAFGAQARLEQFMTDKKLFDGFHATPVSTATNIENALSTAMTLLDDSRSGRIVLITDGEANVGDISALVPSIIAGAVELKVLKAEKETVPEVYVDQLDVPEKISIGDTFAIKVNVVSNISTDATLYLYQGRSLKNTENVRLEPGENHFVYNDTHTDSGLASYRVVVDAGSDTQTVNNEYYAYTTIETAPKVLIIEGQAGMGSEFGRLMDAANVAWDSVTPAGTPESLDALLEYKSVITVDVHGDDLKDGFMDMLETYVRDYGGGFIATGGENSFALGAYKDTPLERILPVSMDLEGEKEIPSMTMVMVIDHSGSMADGDGRTTNLDLAKSAALAALYNLRGSDKIGVLGFSDDYTWNCPIMNASDTQKAQDGIMAINITGGTSIYPALAEAVDALEEDDSALRHIILLTDGQDGYREYDDLLERIDQSNITLSTVSVGRDADTELLSDLAQTGNGRYYHTDITTNLPRIFSKEVFLSAKAYLNNRDFVPAVSSNNAVITGVTADGLPVMHGYVATTARDTADVLLVSDTADPILATWQYGLGRTAAFTSDVKNMWTSEYAGWDMYTAFWKNIVESTITEDSSGEVSGTAVMDGSTPKITYKTKDYSGDTKVSAICTGADGSTEEIVLSPTSPGTFEGEITGVGGTGVYSINIRQSDGGTISHTLNTALAVPYSKEYRFAEGTDDFDAFVSSVSGSYIHEPGEVFDTQLQKVFAVRPLTAVFLVLAVFIFMADIILRRLGLYGRLCAGVLQAVRIPGPLRRIKSSGKADTGPKSAVSAENSEKIIKKSEKDTKLEKNTKKVIEKTQRRGYNKTESVLDTKALLQKKKDRDSKV